MLILLTDVVGTMLWDRLMLLVFAPDILFASLKGTKMAVGLFWHPSATFIWQLSQDFFKLVRIFAIVMGILYFFTFDEETWAEIEKAQQEAKQT